MEISWFKKDVHEGVATVYSTNITINKKGCSRLDEYYGVLIGLVEKDKLIVIKPLTKDETLSPINSGNSPLKLSFGLSYARVSSCEFIKSVSSLINYNFAQGAKKYYTRWEEKENILII